ncbi:MAG: hypothetical protein COA86_02290 [Kangiella sp.]|nr:MAG: hypothetical protein COA86_02290 [Kangiella sp.]
MQFFDLVGIEYKYNILICLRNKTFAIQVASPLQGEGQWFEPTSAHQFKTGLYPLWLQAFLLSYSRKNRLKNLMKSKSGQKVAS